MANVTLNGNLEEIVDKALEGATMFLRNKIEKITPRDPNRPPKDPSRKITGNLKRSVIYKKNNKPLSYVIGVSSGISGGVKNRARPIEYGYYLEFGTRRMKARSFLRKGLLDYTKETENYFNSLMSKYSKQIP